MNEEEVNIVDGEELADGEDEDINIVDDGSKLDDRARRFDVIVGALEDVLMDPEFEELRESFCRENCRHFEDSDENKLIYTDLFARYTSLVENTIESKLKEAVPGFSMAEFSSLLETHRDSLMSDVFDLLLSMGDFESFKEVMLSYKREVEDGRSSFGVHCTPLKIHTQEQEDGEERPDLDLSLQISPIGNGPMFKR